MKRNLAEGSILKNIVFFSLPYLLSYFLQTLYGMADLFIIGQFDGIDSTTAVSIGSQVMNMITVMIVGLAMGSTVVIGRSVGAGDKKRASNEIGNTITLFMVVSLVLTAVLLIFVKPIVSVVSTPTEAVDGTISYLTICFIGIPFITAYNIISSIFRGMGDSKSPMYFIAVACAANIALDYLFIGVLDFDTAGAALGTTLSQTVSVIVSLTVIIKRKNLISICLKDLKPKVILMKNILKIGIPVAFQDGFIQISFIIITIIANRRGLDDAAAVGIVEKLIGILFLVPSSLLSTVSVISAQNLGAGKPERAKATLRYATIINVSIGIVSAVSMQFFAEGAVGLFTSDTNVILYGGEYMRSYVWDCILAGVHFCFSGYFCACGKSGISFLHNFLSIVLARVPIAYFASKMFADTLFPMGFAAPIGSVLSVIICVIAYIVINKKSKSSKAVSA
ncbi:MAG: MATE family efflux transporter [Ruminococcus bromii]|uniref:MATE family efflux transporter n=1 Tax=Ruminococcus sp. YE282 TaxID=3158780 RepID=UPI00088C97A0|nr:MATE family efflux transporter [Ruminococcus bromii]MCI7212024.1 MATE family efflux transporter [Ruminococcus bromii]MDD6434262.1 MATE family efflux transporter [Ruminococcus bromii]MDY4710668.1 MATE family efflux transporter [Ruminococcus bromii]SCY34533.1 putative efflux protein, MATE family [Ruminococcus bromii]